MGPVAIIVLLIEVINGIHLDFTLGPLGPLPFDILSRDYPKAIEGAMGYKCTNYGPCFYCRSFSRGDKVILH